MPAIHRKLNEKNCLQRAQWRCICYLPKCLELILELFINFVSFNVINAYYVYSRLQCLLLLKIIIAVWLFLLYCVCVCLLISCVHNFIIFLFNFVCIYFASTFGFLLHLYGVDSCAVCNNTTSIGHNKLKKTIQRLQLCSMFCMVFQAKCR